MTPQETIPDWVRAELDDIREAADEVGGLVKERLDVLLGATGGTPQPKGKLSLGKDRTIKINGTPYTKSGNFDIQVVEEKVCLDLEYGSAPEPRLCVSADGLKRIRIVAPEGGGVYVIAEYKDSTTQGQDLQVYAGQYTCIRCGDTIVCGVDPDCDPVPPVIP